MSTLPKTWIEFWYLISKDSLPPVLSALSTLVVFFFISQVIDTEWYAVGAAAMGSAAGQLLNKKG